METDPASETLCSLEYWVMNEDKNPVFPSIMKLQYIYEYLLFQKTYIL
jgi:hypothetical protein